MYSGPIKLPQMIQDQCQSLIHIGGSLQIYSISMFMHVMDVHRRIVMGANTILDLQEIILLCDILIDHPFVGNNLIADLREFKKIIQMFIDVASLPSRSCGMWNNVGIPFDEDDLL